MCDWLLILSVYVLESIVNIIYTCSSFYVIGL